MKDIVCSLIFLDLQKWFLLTMASAELNRDEELQTNVHDFLMRANDACVQGKPLALTFPCMPANSYDLVYPGIYLGNGSVARKLDVLKSLGVTHIVNAAHGSKHNQVNTSPDFYQDANITFHGIPALDIMTYNILPHLRPAAEFTHKAHQDEGVVYVHCQQGVSRSATVVLAYLMLHHNYPLMEAVRIIRGKREIFPNDGFLKQLCVLQKDLKGSAAEGSD